MPENTARRFFKIIFKKKYSDEIGVKSVMYDESEFEYDTVEDSEKTKLIVKRRLSDCSDPVLSTKMGNIDKIMTIEC